MHIKKNNITSEQRYIPGIAQENVTSHLPEFRFFKFGN